MYQYILFDFDGTIADSEQVVYENLTHLCGKYGFHKFSYEEFKPYAPLSIWKKMSLLLFLRKIEWEFKQLYGERIDAIQAFDCMPEVLSFLQAAGYRLAILSSNTVSNIEKFLAFYQINLDIPVFSSRGLYAKHRSIRKFLKQHACLPEALLYVGDERRDIRACQKAGVDIAFVTWGLDGKKDTRKLKPTYRISTPLELLSIL